MATGWALPKSRILHSFFSRLESSSMVLSMA